MRKKLVSLGLAGLMGAMSVMPAFAADNVETLVAGKAGMVQDVDGAEIDPSAKSIFEALEDNENSADGVDYYNGLEGDFADTAQSKETEVAVQQAMSYVVQLPAFISVGQDDCEVEYHAGLYADVASSSTITIKPNLTNAAEGVANDANTYAAFADGTGSFPLKEDGGLKKDIKATITLDDIDWSLKTATIDDADGNDIIGAAPAADGEAYTYVEHNGTVTVEGLSAGTWRNTINFDVTYENSDN